MDNISRYLLTTIAFIFVCLLFWIVFIRKDSNIFQSDDCSNNRYIMDMEFKGIVTRKFLDLENHNYKTIIISKDKFNFNLPITFDRDSVLWTRTKVGDSLTKKLYSSIFVMKRKLQLDSIKVDYPCR